MKVLSATVISPGLARGKVWIPKDPLAIGADAGSAETVDVMVETGRLGRVIEEVKTELRAVADQVGAQLSEDLAEIFRTHEMMLDSFVSSREFDLEIESGGKPC